MKRLKGGLTKHPDGNYTLPFYGKGRGEFTFVFREGNPFLDSFSPGLSLVNLMCNPVFVPLGPKKSMAYAKGHFWENDKGTKCFEPGHPDEDFILFLEKAPFEKRTFLAVKRESFGDFKIVHFKTSFLEGYEYTFVIAHF